MPPRPILAGLEQSPTIKVNGAALSLADSERLVHLSVESSLGASGRFEMRFDDIEGMGQGKTFAIGKEVAIAFDDGDGNPVEVFKGDIMSLSVDASYDHLEMIVAGYDHRSKLGTGIKERTFLQQSYSDILTQIAGESSLQAEIDSSLGRLKHSHVTQASTNQEFVGEIARRTGMDWYVHDQKLHVLPRGTHGAEQLVFGEGLFRFTARYSTADSPSGVTVRGWDPKTKATIVGSAGRSDSGPTNDVPIGSSPQGGSRPAISWTRPLGSQDEATSVAKGIARRMLSAELVGRGETIGRPALRPGMTCDVSQVGPDWSGSYYVTSTEHVYGRNQPYTTRFVVGSVESSSLVDLLGHEDGGSDRAITSGVTVGIVTNNNDPEQGRGRVKVRYPYLTDQNESDWARVASIGAGPTRGIAFQPEINDEVLVAFEHGDIGRPYVIGGLWNGKDVQPTLTPLSQNKVQERLIRSRVGHVLRFLDGEGDNKRSVAIETADGKTKIFLGQDKVELISTNKPITVKNGPGKIEISDRGDITLNGPNITINADQNIKLKAGVNLEIEAGVGLKLKGTTVESNSSASAKFASSGITEVKGSLLKLN